jgi:hypothetical protein
MNADPYKLEKGRYLVPYCICAKNPAKESRSKFQHWIPVRNAIVIDANCLTEKTIGEPNIFENAHVF